MTSDDASTGRRTTQRRLVAVNPGRMVDGSVALVTGGGTGIGQATAELLAEEGARAVAVGGRTATSLEETAELVRAYGCEALTVVGDISAAGGAAAMVQSTESRLGRMDIAVNAVGITGPIKPVEAYTADEWSVVHETNLGGVFRCLSVQVPAIARTGGGAIVNVSSGSGIDPVPNMAAYSSSKAGLQGLSRAVAGECASQGVRVNVVQPGGTLTPLLRQAMEDPSKRTIVERVPMKRFAEPREIAEAIVWLASPRASYVTGAELVVAGGRHAFDYRG